MVVTFPKNVSKQNALEAMWRNSKTAPFFAMNGNSPSSLNHNELSKALRTDYVDYLCGRVIKTNFRNYPTVGTLGYDRDNGKGALQKVINSL